MWQAKNWENGQHDRNLSFFLWSWPRSLWNMVTITVWLWGHILPSAAIAWFWYYFVRWSGAIALQTQKFWDCALQKVNAVARAVQLTFKCIGLGGESLLRKTVWADMRESDTLVCMGLPLKQIWPKPSKVSFSAHVLCSPQSILMPFAARPRFTQPAKMRRRVIARPVGSSIRLKCVASGNPRPDITWLKDNKPLTPQEIGENKKKKWTLNLKNLKPEDSGKYTCRVFNKVGEINATYKVEVIRKCSCGRESREGPWRRGLAQSGQCGVARVQRWWLDMEMGKC